MGEKVRVVFDTNVWVSILFNKVLAKDILPLIRKKRIDIFISEELLKELARVLTYPKIESILTKAQLDPKIVLTSILESVTYVRAEEAVREVEEDPADNRVLECALSANADFVVSGDRHLLNLGEYKGIKILKARKFLAIVNWDA